MYSLSLQGSGFPGKLVLSWALPSLENPAPISPSVRPAVPQQARSALADPFHIPYTNFVERYRDPKTQAELLSSLGQGSAQFNEKKFVRAIDQMLPRVAKATPRINKIKPELLQNGTVAGVLNELFGVDAVKEFTMPPAKKSFWDKIPPILSITANDYAAGFASPFASLAVGAFAASLAYFFPNIFFDTFPKLQTSFDWSWLIRIFGFSAFCTYLISGWKNFFGEFLPKTYRLKSEYLDGQGKIKKYLELQLHEGLVGLQTEGILKDLRQRTRIFDSAKKYLGNVPLLGKFIKTLPETSGEAATFATDIGLNIFATAAFLFIMKGADFKLLPALMPSAILTLFNCFGTTYITKSIKDSPGKIVAFRQILGIALFVFAAATTTEFGGEFVMHPAVRAGSQVLAGLAMLTGVGTLVKPQSK